MRVLRFLSGALLGAAIGATVAMLMAPASGEELRGQLQQRAETFRDELSEAAKSRRIELEKQLAELRKPKKSVEIEAEAVEA